MLAIGADIGGSHITCGLVNLEERSLVLDTIVTHAVDNRADADVILQVWSDTLREALKGLSAGQLAGAGFAMPGPFDYVHGIGLFKDRPKYQKLHNVDVASRLTQLMHFSPAHAVRFMNDATSFAVGEAWIGKAMGFHKTLVITLGTGFGSAFLKDSIPVVKGDHVPPMGCVWHLPFKEGISDDYFSTRWIVRRYEEVTGIREMGVKKIADHAKTKTEIADIFSEFGENLGVFLSPWIKKFHADILVIGGNIGRAYPLFGEGLQESLRRQRTDIITETSELMEKAALTGSARLLDESFWQRVKELLPNM